MRGLPPDSGTRLQQAASYLREDALMTIPVIAGLSIIVIAILCGAQNILPKGVKSTCFIGFDIVELIHVITKKQLIGVGLILMASGGFAGYMSQIGASNALVNLCTEPLRKLRSPYLVLALAYLTGQLVNLVIVSAAGLVMLLMVAFYPILTRVGVSRAAAASAIVLCSGISAGPLFATEQLAARIAGLDPMAYFMSWQLGAVAPAYIVCAAALCLTQKYFDSKNGDILEEAHEAMQPAARECPRWYAIFPFMPIILLFIFSEFGIKSVQLSTTTSLMLTWLIVAAIELIRLRDMKTVFADCTVFFQRMGTLFGSVVALVICAEVFASSLRISGLISEVITLAEGLGLGVSGMTGVLSGLVSIVTVLTGSGVGAFSAFGSISADIAHQMNGELAAMLVPIQLASSVFRTMSPVAGCLIAAALIAGVSPMSIVRRTAIPAVVTFGAIFAMNMFMNF